MNYRIIHAALTACLVLCPLAADARTSKPYEETVKKHSWFSFNKPAETNAPEQLARAVRFEQQGEFKKAGKSYKALVTTWPGSVEAPTAQYGYARMLEKRGKLEDAFDEYQVLFDKYVGEFPYQQSLESQFRIANYVMTHKKGKFLIFPGFTAPERAADLFEKIVRNAPRSPMAAEAQYLSAKAYEMGFDYELAVVGYMVAEQRYSTTPFAEQAAFGRARCWYRLSEENPNDDESLEQAWASLVHFARMYPESEHAEVAKAYRETILRRRAEAAYNKAVFYEKIAHKPDAARATYENFVKLFPNSEWTGLAEVRIKELTKQPQVEKKDDQ